MGCFIITRAVIDPISSIQFKFWVCGISQLTYLYTCLNLFYCIVVWCSVLCVGFEIFNFKSVWFQAVKITCIVECYTNKYNHKWQHINWTLIFLISSVKTTHIYTAKISLNIHIWLCQQMNPNSKWYCVHCCLMVQQCRFLEVDDWS